MSGEKVSPNTQPALILYELSCISKIMSPHTFINLNIYHSVIWQTSMTILFFIVIVSDNFSIPISINLLRYKRENLVRLGVFLWWWLITHRIFIVMLSHPPREAQTSNVTCPFCPVTHPVTKVSHSAETSWNEWSLFSTTAITRSIIILYLFANIR